jgi:hypothetical protein
MLGELRKRQRDARADSANPVLAERVSVEKSQGVHGEVGEFPRTLTLTFQERNINVRKVTLMWGRDIQEPSSFLS